MLTRAEELLHTRENILACLLGKVTGTAFAVFFGIIWLVTDRPATAACCILALAIAGAFNEGAWWFLLRLQALERRDP